MPCRHCEGRMREDREIWVREANFVREVWICEECGEVESFEREIAGY